MMIDVTPIKGAKKGQEEARKPKISKDSVASTSTAKILYGLAEGEVSGLVDGGKSIFLDGTPILDSSGKENFSNVKFDFRHGTNEQSYIQGFPDVSNETPINVELRGGTPWVQSFNDKQVDAIRVRLRWGNLSTTNIENGDVTGHRIDYAIDMKVDNSSYMTMITTKIEDKTSAGYQRTHRIDLPRANNGWQIRVRRLTPNDDSDLIQDTMYIDAVAEVIDAKLRYPNTALLGIEYDAETFSRVAKLAVHLKGSIIRVPSNYNPVLRVYVGIWDGTFKDAYSNNPAWVYFDLCTQWRYGLGEKLDLTMIDKWSLYQLGQYCDERVSNGMGGLEPRFTCNVYLQSQVDAHKVLSNIAGIFRAMSYWNGERIIVDADVPQDPTYTFSRANVVGGNFEYTGTRQRDRHTVIKVAWDNPKNGFETEYEFVRDEQAIAKFGVKVLDLSAFACTSQAQAQRAGHWAILTEQLETRQAAFSVGLDGFIPRVGNIINVSDELFMGRATGGRIIAVSDAQYVITVDRDIVAKSGDTLVINVASGNLEKRAITKVVGRKITVSTAFTTAENENVWAIESPDLKLMRFRVMSITQNDDTTFNITAIQHEPKKYLTIDNSASIKPSDVTNNNQSADNSIDAPLSVALSARYRIVQAATVTTLVINWTQVEGAIAYDIEYRKDSGSWITVPRTSNITVDLDNIFIGTYTARVRAVNAYGVQSAPTESAPFVVAAKESAPPALFSFQVNGILFGMHLSWQFGDNSEDGAYVEIEEATEPNVNIKQLGIYAYPTNSVTLQGLGANVTVFYRARLVDKSGFVGAWTSWKEGLTDADAEKVLELLAGQISETQLDRDLQTGIASISGLSAKVDNEIIERQGVTDALAQQTSTIQSQSNGNRASIQQQAQSINGLNAQYTVKVDVNGAISGFGLASSNQSSAFAIHADRFYIAGPYGSTSHTPAFVYQANSYNDPISGTVVPSGLYLHDAFIQNASMTTAKIRGQAVTVTSSVSGTLSGTTTSSVYLSSGGGSILLRVTFYGVKGGGSQTVRLYKNGSVIQTYALTGGGIMSMSETFEEVTSGGFGTDTFYATWDGAEYVRSATVTAISLKR